MPALDAGIHALLSQNRYPIAEMEFSWMAGASPPMPELDGDCAEYDTPLTVESIH